MTPDVMKMFAVGIAAGLGMLGPALALGLIGYAALTGISRNPEAAGPILTKRRDNAGDETLIPSHAEEPIWNMRPTGSSPTKARRLALSATRKVKHRL